MKVSKKDNNKILATTFYFTKNGYLCTLNKWERSNGDRRIIESYG